MVYIKLIVGLTGGIGSGKSIASEYLNKKYDIENIDADVIARKVILPGTDTYIKTLSLFGKDFFRKDGLLNRERVRSSIFSDEALKKRYESIIHPAIRDEILLQLKDIKASSKREYIILSAPLLFENNLNKYTDINVVIDCSNENQLQRIKYRDESKDINTIKSIISSQLSREERNKKANFIIKNNKLITDFYHELDKLHKNLLVTQRNHLY